MPFTGQNLFNSAPANSRGRSLDKVNQVRSGQWNQLNPERSSGSKYLRTKGSTMESIASGKFRGNIRDKQAQLNQKSVSGFFERKRIIDQG
jgi:hypothetical protein